MHAPSDHSDRRRDKTTALIALALLVALAAYHVWDVRGAFSDFEGWWAYAQPEFPGDDYVAVVGTAEHHADWHSRFRAIALGMGIRRAVDDVTTLVRPQDFWLLWAESESTQSTWDHAGIKEDYFHAVTSQTETAEVDYDPILGAPVIDEWREQGWVTELSWSTAYVSDGTDDDTIVLHTDETRTWIYAVPAHMSPVSTDDGSDD